MLPDPDWVTEDDADAVIGLGRLKANTITSGTKRLTRSGMCSPTSQNQPVDPRQLRRFLAAVPRDERLESLDWQTLEELARTVNAVSGKPVVRQSGLEKARHPLGRAHSHWERERAAEEYPKETAELLRVLEAWRHRMRTSATGW